MPKKNRHLTEVADANGRWWAMPDGWRFVEDSMPPMWANGIITTQHMAIVQHCDGFYIANVERQGDVTVQRKIAGTDAGALVGPFPSWVDAYTNVLAAAK